MAMHDGEVRAGVDVVRRLLRRQRPDLAGLPVTPIGGGTDNTMYRVGDDLLMRLPRTAGKADSLAKELRWLPVLAPVLSTEVPEPVFAGEPAEEFPLRWAVYRWIDGRPASEADVTDWPAYGRDLAVFVAELHSVGLNGAKRSGELSWYRGGLLQARDEWVRQCLSEMRALGADVDVVRLERQWAAALALPAPTSDHVWLHGDLKPTNVIVSEGRLRAVVDFGGLSIGLPDAEHAPVWDVPAAARVAYRDALAVDEPTWLRARAWALMIGVSGVPYYWETYPEFVDECLHRLRAVAADD